MARSISPILDDSARWAAVIDGCLPPRASWPNLRFRLPSLRYPDTLNLAEHLLTSGDVRATAILWRDQRLSYRQLRDCVLEAAAALDHLGVRPADRVAFRLHNSPDFIVTWLAVQWVGAIGVPIPPVYRRREIAHILEHSGASRVVSSADLAEEIEAARATMSNPPTVVSTPLDRPGGVPPPPYPVGRDFPALITYITCDTGAPRGIVHSPSELLATADTYAREVLALTPRDVCIAAMSAAWSYGLGALLVFPLRAGASTVLVEGSGLPLPAVIADAGATVLFAVPTMYRLLLRQPDLESYGLSSVRCCVSAAEPLTAAVTNEWRSRTGLEILDGLGTTELAHIFISTRSGSARPGSIGQVVAGYEARVIDDHGREVPPGVEGLLAVRGPTGARYWRDAEAQRQTVRGGWTLTGDICSRDADGWFQYGRRVDDLIVCGGYKVSPAEVQRALEDHPDVASARVFAATDDVRGNVPRATVTLAAGVDEAGAAERLQQYLKQELAPYKCPRTIEIA